MPPPPELDRLPGGGAEDSQDPQVSRRALISGLLACALLQRGMTGLGALDEVLPNLLYGTSPTTVDTIATRLPVERLPHVSRRALFYGGIGQGAAVSRADAGLLARSTYKGEPVSYLAYSPAGLVDAELAGSYNRFEAATDEVDIIANSMGWIVLCRSLLERRRQAYAAQFKNPAKVVAEEHLGKRIRSVTLCSSPSNVHDVWHGDAIQEIVDELNPGGTMSEKWLVELVDEMVNNHQKFGPAARNAYRQLFSTLPSRLWASQFVMLARTNTLTYVNELRPFFRGTHFLYAMPEIASDDHTVNVNLACPNLRKFAQVAGAASFTECLMPDAGHADIRQLSKNKQARQWVMNIRNGITA